jgi:AraC family transcriptional regulator
MVGSTNRLEYEQRVNRVIDHIRDHLAEELSLASLARVAAFSPFHFHRVFKAITTETLFGFIQRLRIEKAAGVLRDDPGCSVLEVALDHGFASAATFARAFRAHFGMSATVWRAGGAERWRERRRRERKPGKAFSKAGKASPRRRADTGKRRVQDRRRAVDASIGVHVRELPAHYVAYMRYVGPYGAYGIPELWMKLRTWMTARGLELSTTLRLGLGHDDPSVTAADKCRYDACVVVPPEFPSDRSINFMKVPGGRHAVWDFTGTTQEIEGTWDKVFSVWLPGSGYQPDDRPGFELYRGDCTVDARARTFHCELCLPVRPL